MSGKASSALSLVGLASLATLANGVGSTTLLVIGTLILIPHLVIATVLTIVTSRVVLDAARSGKDPIQLIRLLVSFLRAIR
jgi:hypothetical protein